MTSYQYRKSHCGDKTILRLSYLHIGISYTGEMPSLYWIRALRSNNVSGFAEIFALPGQIFVAFSNIFSKKKLRKNEWSCPKVPGLGNQKLFIQTMYIKSLIPSVPIIESIQISTDILNSTQFYHIKMSYKCPLNILQQYFENSHYKWPIEHLSMLAFDRGASLIEKHITRIELGCCDLKPCFCEIWKFLWETD